MELQTVARKVRWQTVFRKAEQQIHGWKVAATIRLAISWFSGWLFNFSIANIPSWLFVLYLELQFDDLDGGTVVVTLGVDPSTQNPPLESRGQRRSNHVPPSYPNTPPPAYFSRMGTSQENRLQRNGVANSRQKSPVTNSISQSRATNSRMSLTF
jgi:hypothetical protein